MQLWWRSLLQRTVKVSQSPHPPVVALIRVINTFYFQHCVFGCVVESGQYLTSSKLTQEAGTLPRVVGDLKSDLNKPSPPSPECLFPVVEAENQSEPPEPQRETAREAESGSEGAHVHTYVHLIKVRFIN